MGELNAERKCEFDKLFTKSVPHILEKIFFSLDYTSFKKCMEVNTAWRELLTSESYKRLGKITFHEDIQGNLMYAINGGNALEVRRVISCGMVDVNSYDEYRMTPLLFAVRWGLVDIVKLLIEEGAEVNKKYYERQFIRGWGPIHMAAFKGCQDVLQLLIDNGAEVNLVNDEGCAPLHLASRSGYKDIVQVLIDRGARVNLATHSGQTPLTYAQDYRHTHVANLIREYGGTE